MNAEYRVVRAGSELCVPQLLIARVRMVDGKPDPMYTAVGEPGGESLDGLRQDLEEMLAALAKPILDSRDVSYSAQLPAPARFTLRVGECFNDQKRRTFRMIQAGNEEEIWLPTGFGNALDAPQVGGRVSHGGLLFERVF